MSNLVSVNLLWATNAVLINVEFSHCSEFMFAWPKCNLILQFCNFRLSVGKGVSGEACLTHSGPTNLTPDLYPLLLSCHSEPAYSKKG